MEIQFYHLLTTPLEVALPKLLAKAYASDARLLLKAADKRHAKALDELLWTYHPDSFLPHGCEGEAFSRQQPVLIHTDIGANDNQASVLVIADGSWVATAPAGINRILDIFDGTNENELMAARGRWKQYKETGATLTYIRQQPDGSWKKEA